MKSKKEQINEAIHRIGELREVAREQGLSLTVSEAKSRFLLGKAEAYKEAANEIEEAIKDWKFEVVTA